MLLVKAIAGATIKIKEPSEETKNPWSGTLLPLVNLVHTVLPPALPNEFGTLQLNTSVKEVPSHQSDNADNSENLVWKSSLSTKSATLEKFLGKIYLKLVSNKAVVSVGSVGEFPSNLLCFALNWIVKVEPEFNLSFTDERSAPIIPGTFTVFPLTL